MTAVQGVRYTIREPARREVLARLLALNHERYAEEVKAGLYEKKGKKGGKVQGATFDMLPIERTKEQMQQIE